MKLPIQDLLELHLSGLAEGIRERREWYEANCEEKPNGRPIVRVDWLSTGASTSYTVAAIRAHAESILQLIKVTDTLE